MRKIAAAAALTFGLSVLVYAQGRGGRGPQGPPPTAKALAPIDMTGYWVSLITEDWRYRMMVPQKGDFPSIPLNPAGRKIADAWDPAKETPAEACKSYGAANIMRTPGRLHVTWADDNTMKVEMDNGEQTRLFHFGEWTPPGGAATWQGDSVAKWEYAGEPPRGGRPTPERGGDLEVTTMHMRPGYLQKNGVPYSGNALVTEHFDVTHEPDGSSMLIVTTLVLDPTYLTQHFMRSSHFKKQADAAGWDPTPCSSK